MKENRIKHIIYCRALDFIITKTIEIVHCELLWYPLLSYASKLKASSSVMLTVPACKRSQCTQFYVFGLAIVNVATRLLKTSLGTKTYGVRLVSSAFWFSSMSLKNWNASETLGWHALCGLWEHSQCNGLSSEDLKVLSNLPSNVIYFCNQSHSMHPLSAGLPHVGRLQLFFFPGRDRIPFLLMGKLMDLHRHCVNSK